MKAVILRTRESQDAGSSAVGMAGRAERRDVLHVRVRQMARGPGWGTGIGGALDLVQRAGRLVGRSAGDDYFPA